MFLKGEVIDAGVNYEIYKRLVEIEQNKPDGRPQKVQKPRYEVNDKVF